MSTEIQQPINNIVIVGGGSAGWLTAGLLAAEHANIDNPSVRVTLVESPLVKTIGVGEGTWPTMRTTLQKIGLSESQFLLECTASFKQGTQFVQWVTGADDDVYYHPFSAPAGYGSINLAAYWQERRDQLSFVDAVTVQGRICDHNLAPKQESTPEFAAVANYAYHLDAGRFAALLQKHCIETLNVRHVLDHVTGVNGEPDGDIRSIATEQSGNIEGDLFIDCSGMSALLLGRHYQVPYLEKKHILFNDAAYATQVPYPDDDSPIASQTVSTAQSAGWIWDIGLTSRRGVGHVYSTAHSSDADAEAALKRYVARTSGLSEDQVEARKIAFTPGHRKRFWHRNCVAVGMSAGFLEPLEASALVLVELSARMISEELPAHRGVMDIVARRFNEKFRYRWDRIIEFLKLHYVLSQRSDSQYWVDNRHPEGIPDSLAERLELWRQHVPWHRDFSQVDEVFSSASYQYVLYGMGFETRVRRTAGYEDNLEKARQLFSENTRKAAHMLSQLPDNRTLLNRLRHTDSPTMKAG